ncbi:hypothetical protein EW146_g2430 [Bondarzewia mesenterica]|uniref:Uncharacterized protein n=1 Tax=Bondarzewia mesenterica TaxID=1095465 RepID=A0A4S4M161_9AGAM|nr:hypothetical protein EW146_g2430 [Bondarzewia mesenterica]
MPHDNKANILHLFHDDSVVALNPFISPTDKSKSVRGFNHMEIGRVLYPYEFDWDNEEVRENIKGGTNPNYIIMEALWPRFMYASSEYNPEDVQQGLLRNSFLVRVMKHIITSPGSAYRFNSGAAEYNCTHSSNAEIHGIKKMMPRLIAYTVVLSIVELFEDAGEWGKDTLAWWDMMVFGKIALNRGSTPK